MPSGPRAKLRSTAKLADRALAPAAPDEDLHVEFRVDLRLPAALLGSEVARPRRPAGKAVRHGPGGADRLLVFQ